MSNLFFCQRYIHLYKCGPSMLCCWKDHWFSNTNKRFVHTVSCNRTLACVKIQRGMALRNELFVVTFTQLSPNSFKREPVVLREISPSNNKITLVSRTFEGFFEIPIELAILPNLPNSFAKLNKNLDWYGWHSNKRFLYLYLLFSPPWIRPILLKENSISS